MHRAFSQEFGKITAVAAGLMRSCFPDAVGDESAGGAARGAQQAPGAWLRRMPQNARTGSLHSRLPGIQPLAYR